MAGPAYEERVPLASLKPMPGNPRRNEPAVGPVAESIKRFGWTNPILARASDRVVVAGHTRLAAAKQLGLAEVPVIWLDLNETDSKLYNLADNKLAQLAEWDTGPLADMLRELQQEDAAGLLIAGFGEEEVNALLAATAGVGNSSAVEPTEDEFSLFPAERVAEAAFAFFRKTGFPYRRLSLHAQMQEMNRLAMTSQDAALGSRAGYKVADTYNPHRFHAHAAKRKSPVDAFGSDALLRKAIALQLQFDRALSDEYFHTLNIVSGVQSCSNFRPAFAMHLYRRFGVPGGTVLDPSTGYGGRLVGWIASRLGGKYVGVDPSTKTHEGNSRLAEALAPSGSVQLVNKPFEDVDLGKLGLLGAVDFAFTSPPYFSKEEYADEPTQSFKRYPTADGWRGGFLVPLMRGIASALKPGRFACINIADVTVDSADIPLEAWTMAAAKSVGLLHQETLRFDMTTRVGANQDNDEVATEPAFIFKRAG